MIYLPVKNKSLVHTQLKLKINNNVIEKVHQFPLLGVVLDDQINWKHHIRKVQNKILSIIGILYRICDKIDIKTSLLLYDALIGSHLSYCNIVWGFGYTASLEALYTCQKRALKLCLKLPKRADTNIVFSLSNKLTIHEINSLQIAILAYMVINKNTPKSVTTFFISTKMIHFYNNRAKLNLQVCFAKSNTRKFVQLLGVLFYGMPFHMKLKTLLP